MTAAAPGKAGIVFRGALALLFAVLLAGLALVALLAGFKELRELRQLERTPRSLVAGVLPGEVNLRGTAQPMSQLLTSPHTSTPTLFYRYHVERKTRDSEGRTRWSTVRNESRFVSFWLEDDSGRIQVEPSARANFEVWSRFSLTEGDMRYTEYRIDPGDPVFLFAHAERRGGAMVVGFDTEAQYWPLISTYGEAAARAGMARVSIFLLWLGLAFASFAIYWICWALRIHLSVMYLGALSVAMALLMVMLSTRTARDDLQASFSRSARDAVQAEALIVDRLAAAGIGWDGDWSALGDFGEARYARLDPEQRRVLSHVRARLAAQIDRTLEVRQHWPERSVARTLRLPELPRIPVPEGLEAEALVDRPAPTSTGPLGSSALSILMLLLATLLAWLGFRRIRLKRTIENLPTSRSAGVAYGLTELLGLARLDKGEQALSGPVSGLDCVWFHYLVQERRGSGKNARWVTIENRRTDRRFWLEDSEGRIPVDPDKAETMVSRCSTRRQGRMRYSEHRIEPGMEVYVLGSAGIDPRTGSSLAVGRGPKDQPFLISDLPEAEIMLRKARSGFLFLNLGVNTGNASALAALGGAAALHGLGFLFAALVPLGFFAVFLAILMYNDLVMLRQRVRLTWANIQVSLAKRADLVPRLETVLKAYLEHERGLQQDLARLRSLAQQGGIDTADAARLVGVEQGVIERLLWLREAYPDLKSSALALQLSRTLIALENEVALMREGYNNAVERYNTRCQHIPEVVFAKLFRFLPAELFRAETRVREVPALLLDESAPPPEASPTASAPPGPPPIPAA